MIGWFRDEKTKKVFHWNGSVWRTQSGEVIHPDSELAQEDYTKRASKVKKRLAIITNCQVCAAKISAQPNTFWRSTPKKNLIATPFMTTAVGILVGLVIRALA